MEEIIDNVYYKRLKNTIFIAFCVNQTKNLQQQEINSVIKTPSFCFISIFILPSLWSNCSKKLQDVQKHRGNF